MEIKFEDYLSEEEKKEIVLDVFRGVIKPKIIKDAERILGNMAYSAVFEMVDKELKGNSREIIRDKSLKIIDKLTEFSVFRKKDRWDTEESPAFKYLQEAVKDNKKALYKRIETIIQDIPPETLKSHILDALYEFLETKIFCKNKANENN